MPVILRGIGLLLSGLVFIAGAVFYSIFPPAQVPLSPAGSPTSTATAPASSPTASLRPENSGKVLSPSEQPTEAQTPATEPTGPILVPTVVPLPTFLPLPTPTLLPLPSLPLGAEGCHDVPITPNTPSGIAGCIQWGKGTASFYTDSGMGAAMNFCTWSLRMLQGCGSVKVTVPSTGRSIVIPVVDFCDCYWLTDRRIIDLQGGAVDALGLDRSRGLWTVEVSRG
jgi:hypothetical protein